MAAPVVINEPDEWRKMVVHMCRRLAIEEHIEHPFNGTRRGEGAYDDGGYKCNPGY